MTFIALKMLIGDRLKYISLVAGLAFAALLVTQQASIFTGYARQTNAWIRDTKVADLWIMDEQVEFTEDLKPMSENKLTRVRGVDGVEWAVPLYKNFFNCIMPDGTRRNVRIIGLDDASLAGGPPFVTSGDLSMLRQDKAIFMDEQATAALKLKRFNPPRQLRVGDRISLNDNEAVVVGTFKSSKEFFWEPVFYTTYSRAKSFNTDRRNNVQYMLVKVRGGVPIEDVARRIRDTTGLKALTGPEFEQLTMDWIIRETGILVNFGMTIALGFLIGVLVSGQTLYTFVLDNLRYFAAIKAMGATNGDVVRMVFIQTFVVAMVGYGIGLGVAVISGMVFQNTGLAFQMTWPIPVVGAVAILFCCMVAAMLSLVRVLRLEAGVVFK